jgi:hypothetical protein
MLKYGDTTTNPPLNKLFRPCFVCGFSAGYFLFEQKFILEDNHPLPSSYSVVACQNCNNIFADVKAKQENYDRFYEQLSKYENESISPGSNSTLWDSERFNRTAKQIQEKLGKNKDASILDIGSAQGGLLDSLAKLGFSTLTALEPSAKCIKMIEKRHGGGGGYIFIWKHIWGSPRNITFKKI